MAARERQLELPGDAASVSRARRAADAALAEWGLEHLADDVILLTSELVTNVVLHARSPGRLVLAEHDGRLRIEVHDDSPLLPLAKDYGATSTTGRGLGLVATLSSEWGATRTPQGKVVWAELDTSASDGDGNGRADSHGELDTSDLDALEAALMGVELDDGDGASAPGRAPEQGATA